MKPHLYIHQPSAIFKARVNITEAISYPISAIPFDNVTLGDYTDIQPDSTILLGTTEGADDLGRVRAKHLSEEGQVNIPRTAKGVEDGLLVLQDEAYITVLDDYRVWGKIPYFDLENGVDYKDGNIEVGTSNTEIPPVANCGPGFAGYIDPDTELITVFFDASFSFPVADGATIVSYDWDVKDGTIIDGTSSDSQITATFPAGFRWVAMTVVDSNDKPHTARCPVLAVDPDDDVTVQGYTLRQNLEKEGQTLDIELFPHLSRDSYLDGTLVMFWIDEASSPSDRSHMKFIGWLDTEQESIRRDREGLIRGTTLKALDICGKLDKLPGFSQALYREEEEDEEENPALPWGYMPSLDMHKCLVYLLFWHSTALELGDFILPSGLKDYDTMRLDSGAGTLFQQVQQQAQKIVPDHYLTCNTKGQMQVQRDWMLDDVGDRPIASPIVTESGWNGLSFDYNRHPRYHSLRSGSILVSTDWVDDGEGNDTLPLVFSVAPGDSAAFSQGASEAVESEGLTLSQEDLNAAEGHRFARMNSRFGNFSFSDPTASGFWEYEPAEFKRVQLNIGADYATKRGLSFTQMVGQVQSISVTYGATREGSRVQVNVNFEKEIEGFPALTTHPDDTVEDWPVVPAPPAPPDMGLVGGQEVVAGIGSDGYVYRTTDFQTPSGSGGPTWDRVDLEIATPIFSWVVDPFSPGYINGSGAINGWVVNETDIYRVTDLFGTPGATSVHTFGKAVDADSGHWRTIQASFGAYFSEGSNPWLLCVSYYGNTDQHTGTYALRSVDGGATWLGETLISPAYETTSTAPPPIGVYTSPKTPGLAYATAFYQGGAPAKGGGYISTDWGETWTYEMEEEDPDELRPGYSLVAVNTYEYLGAVPEPYISGYVEDGPSSIWHYKIVIHPPQNAKKLWLQGEYNCTKVGSTDGGDATYGIGTGSGIIETSDLPGGVFSLGTGGNNSISGTVNMSFELTAAGWARTRQTVEADPTNPGNDQRPSTAISLLAIFADHIAYGGHSLRCTQIEMNDSTIYTPSYDPLFDTGNRLGGSIHIPWPDNDDEGIAFYGRMVDDTTDTYHLIQSVSGVQSDISPVESGVSYGVNGYGFTVRSYDSNRNYMSLAGIGNDAGTNKVGLWVSSNAGAAWTNILSPVAATEALYSLQAAFSGDDPDVLFAWGGYSNASNLAAIYYSDDFGANLDSREGNINSLGTVAFIGIAGGPSA